ncbi:toxin YdaT family protein [Vibrio azureus]|uniref:toxin YdaT family protein n=2 Tax=Vibrio azureus TaxID=512649 RepID=UPI0003A01027|nr:toxin YdaT family protein [Vibrio azureus]
MTLSRISQHLLKVPSALNNSNNTQNLFRYISRTSPEAKANVMDLLPAIIAAMPKQRATAALNQFLNPLGYSVAAIGSSHAMANRDQLLADFSKESSEALRSVLLLSEYASTDQLRNAYRELQESVGSHEPLLKYLETLMVQKA